MSIASEITRLQNAKESLKSSIEAQGPLIPSSATLDTYYSYVDEIVGPQEKTVTFIDYDGTVVEEYTKSEFLALSEMPQNPTHSGLVPLGWNWTLSDAKEYVSNYGWLTIGQIYDTSDGKTKVVVDTNYWPNLDEFSVYYWQSDANSVSVDFGDGSPAQTSSSSYASIAHQYSENGIYTISFSASEGTTFRLASLNATYPSLFGSLRGGLVSSFANARLNGVTDVYVSSKCIGIGYSTYYARVGSYNLKHINLGQNITIMPLLNGCFSLKSVIVPSSITGNLSSFSGCTDIMYVSLPKTVTGMSQSSMFVNCYNLQHIEFPPQITQLSGDYYFFQCINLKNVVIPNGITTIKGSNFFSSCLSIEHINIPDSVQTLSGSNFFYTMESLKELKIPSGASGTFSFGRCRSLESIEAPSSMSATNFNYDCKKLKNFIVPVSNTHISSAYTSGNTSVESLTIPSTITQINNAGFYCYYSLTGVTFLGNITSIGTSAFTNSRIETLALPSSLTAISGYSFAHSYRLKRLTLPDGLQTIGTSAFMYCPLLKEVIIPSGVTLIPDYSFASCGSMNSLTIGSGVQRIGNYAFSGCSSLTNLTIPGNVLSSQTAAFAYSDSLKTLTIEEGGTFIGNSAFSQCTFVSSITLPSTITSIGTYAFSYASRLQSFTITAISPPSLGSYAFMGISSNAKIYVPPESVDAYKAATNWSGQASKIYPITT